MKKGFLFGLGVLIAGGVLAATISTVSIENKGPGGTVTSQEFNEITSGVISLTDIFDGTISNDTTGDIEFTNNITAPQASVGTLCLGADCKSDWPVAEGGTSLTAKTCDPGQQLQSVSATGEFTCGTDMTADGGTGLDSFSCDPGMAANAYNSVEGKWGCIPVGGEGGGVSNQACGTGQVVKGITDGTFDCVLDQNDGGASSPIGTLQSGNWCWSEDGTTINCDRMPPALGENCVDYQYHKCISNKLWWFDSCDMNMAIVKEDCTSLGGCTTNEIGGTCANSASGGTADDLGNHTVTQDLLPNTTNAWDLGSSTKKFSKVYATSFCMGTNCITTWPTGGTGGDGVTITANTCDDGEYINQVNNDGTFVCSGCEDFAKSMCYQGDIYWYDSCGTRGTKKEVCGTPGCSTNSRACNKDIASVPSAPTNVQFQYPNGGFCLATNANVACSMAKISWTAPSQGAPITQYAIEFIPNDNLLLGPPQSDLYQESNREVQDANVASLPSFIGKMFPTAFAQISNPGSSTWASPGATPSTAATSINDLMSKLENGSIVADTKLLKNVNSHIWRVVPGNKTEYIMRAGDIPEGDWFVRVYAFNAIGAGPASSQTNAVGLIQPTPSPVGIGIQERMMQYVEDDEALPF